MPLAAVAAWKRSEEPVSATLFLVEPGDRGTVRLCSTALARGRGEDPARVQGELVGLEIDQMDGLRLGASRHPRPGEGPGERRAVERLEIARWSFDEGSVAGGSWLDRCPRTGALVASELAADGPAAPGGRGSPFSSRNQTAGSW